MQPQAECSVTADMATVSASHGPSAEFINAVSEFLDTDPKDLLVELGYYGDNAEAPAEQQVA